MLHNKNILIGITSSIAAYKMIDIIRAIQAEKANVKVIITENAKKFVPNLVLETFLPNNLYCDLNSNALDHINLAKWCDIFLIAPITANTLCKISIGIADNLLTNVFLACNKKKILSPAMNSNMLQNNAVKRALKILKEDGNTIINPFIGHLACGDVGQGKMATQETIITTLKRELSSKILLNKNIVITAGGTIEDIDPIRSITNKSTGYFAIELAKYSYILGANVILISANIKYLVPDYLKKISVYSAKDLLQASLDCVKEAQVDYYFSVAAISDYYVENKSKQKIKKQDNYQINLKINKDVVSEISNLKYHRPKRVVGFCAETDKEILIESAKKKLINKNLDAIVANLVSNEKGFDNTENSIYLLSKNKEEKQYNNLNKENLSKKIIHFITNK